jgi:hypothetical protein
MTPRMSQRRVYLHVGTPKSGTSYLQDKLALNRDALERQGLDYVRTRKGDHFEAALDLIGEKWAGEEKNVAGQWDALVADARKSRHNVLISHEILAAAGPESVARAMASFPDHEVHVVLTARDLGRQIPAEWQERVKHRGGRDYAAFLKALQRNYTRTDWTVWFWRVQHLPRIIGTWGATLPPERIHLVTVPPADGPSNALWQRFASVLGLSLRASYAESETTNASLGAAEVTMLRRLNGALKDQGVPRTIYVNWVRESIVKEVLAQRPGKMLASVPPRRRAGVEEITASWLEDIRRSGVDVVGDLADLESVWPDDQEHWSDPDQADPAVVADAAIEALAHVLARVGRTPVAEDDTGAVARLTRMLRG